MRPDAAPQCSPTPSLAVTQYEALRTTALGETLAPDARSGLVLFLRRGMWGWAQALAAASAPSPSKGAPMSIATASDERRAVIRVFAALARHTTDQRTP